MSGNRNFFDTSALIEFFDSTSKGKEVEQIIRDSDELFTSSIVLAELTSKLKRRKFDSDEFIKKIESAMLVLPLNSEAAKRGGTIHSQLKPKIPSISLADCLIMANAESEDATVITCDSHFENYQKSRILK